MTTENPENLYLGILGLIFVIWNAYLTYRSHKLNQRLSEIEQFEPKIISMELENTIISDKDRVREELLPGMGGEYKKNMNLILEGVSPHLGRVVFNAYNFRLNKDSEYLLLDLKPERVKFALEPNKPIPTNIGYWSETISLPINVNFALKAGYYNVKRIKLGDLTVALKYEDLQTNDSKEYNTTSEIVYNRD